MGTHCTRLTHLISTIGQITHASNHLIISFFTTSCIGGFNLLWCSTLGLHSLSSWILWVQMPGGMAALLAIVHAIALMYLFNTSSRNFTFHSSKLAAMITSKVLFAPKNAYQRWAGSNFNSSFGCSSVDSLAGGFSWFFISMSSFIGFLDYSPNLDRVATTSSYPWTSASS